MTDRSQQSKDDAAARRAESRNTSEPASGTASAGDATNPQDGRDSGTAGAARPRGKTEDPDITL